MTMTLTEFRGTVEVRIWQNRSFLRVVAPL